jgi:hypothetical protein
MAKTETPRGFSALISVLVISAILVALTLSVSTSSFFARADLLDTENKALARSLAQSCIESALLKLAQNFAYQPATLGDVVTVDATHSCAILSVSSSGSTVTITTRARVQSAHTILIGNVQARTTAQALSPAVPNYLLTDVHEVASTP